MSELKKIVSNQDDAIDKEKSDMVKYQESYDISHLVFLEGVVPTYFIINNVPSPDLVTIQQEHYITEVSPIKAGATLEEMKKNAVTIKPVRTGEMLVKYFKAGCKKIQEGDKVTEVDDEFIATIPSQVLQEVGSYIMTRSIVTESKKK